LSLSNQIGMLIGFNVVLGRLALKAGDTESAKQHLLTAGHSPGSPQMDRPLTTAPLLLYFAVSVPTFS
jgi:hypothetical protein